MTYLELADLMAKKGIRPYMDRNGNRTTLTAILLLFIVCMLLTILGTCLARRF